MTFLHTADWQLGKPFARVTDLRKRSLLQQERLEAITRIGMVARDHQASFIVVAGDLFDSPTATKSTVSAACAKIGALKIPVIVIPGNHDHGGPGSLWDQPFFERERTSLAPNLRVLLTREPVELDDAVIFPCPLLRRRESADPTHGLRSLPDTAPGGEKPRIVIAHGSTQGFGDSDDDDGAGDISSPLIDLNRLPTDAYDYIALGDWHGTKQITSHAWFAGTPERDRPPKGGDYDPGNVLVVSATRGAAPTVIPVRTARFGWHSKVFRFTDDAGVDQLAAQLQELLAQRTDEDLLRLELHGSLNLATTARLEELLETLQSRLLRLKLDNRTVVAPSVDEVTALTQRAEDPLISSVAAKLDARAKGDTEDAHTARIALRELHAAVHAGPVPR